MLRDKRRSPRRKARFALGIMILVCLILLLKLVTGSVLFSVKTVTVIGDSTNLVASQIRKDSLGQNLLVFNESLVTKDVLKNFQVASLNFTKEYPSSIQVTVNLRVPFIIWEGANGKFLVDKNGVAFKKATDESLPVVTEPDKTLNIGSSLSTQTTQKIDQLVESLSSGAISTILLSANTAALQLTFGPIVIFSLEGNILSQSEALQVILQKAKIDGKLPRTVDLEYPNPVVTY